MLRQVPGPIESTDSKNTANGFNVHKRKLTLSFEMTSEFNIQIINSLL